MPKYFYCLPTSPSSNVFLKFPSMADSRLTDYWLQVINWWMNCLCPADAEPCITFFSLKKSTFKRSAHEVSKACKYIFQFVVFSSTMLMQPPYRVTWFAASLYCLTACLFGWLVGWLVGWSIDWWVCLPACLPACLPPSLTGLIDRTIAWLIGQPVSWLSDYWLVEWLMHWLQRTNLGIIQRKWPPVCSADGRVRSALDLCCTRRRLGLHEIVKFTKICKVFLWRGRGTFPFTIHFLWLFCQLFLGGKLWFDFWQCSLAVLKWENKLCIHTVVITSSSFSNRYSIP